MKKLKAVDFFCGAGGMSCGFSQAGVKILAGIDIERQFEHTYKANHNGAKFINRDITQYLPAELENEIQLRKYDDDLIFIGCSPCQYWSQINTDKRKSSYTNNLIHDFQRFIKYFMPGFIVVENVPGILNSTNNHVLLDFLDFLTFHKYQFEYNIINTSNYGVPQIRKRFVLIASRVKENISFPQSTEKLTDMTVANFIGVKNGFPEILDGNNDPSEFKHSTARLTEINKRRILATPKNGGSRLSWKNDPTLQLKAYEGKDNIFSSVYGRMSWDKPSPTITTRFIATSCGRFTHPNEDRGISLREGATLQTFPKDYIFIGGIVSVAKQIGNAVPPEMARRIAQSIINN
jgi:DNA (cytosine-5)-methyltransferase 1